MLNTDTSIPDNNGDVTHASPQLENGYTRIAHELLEALYNANLSSYEFRIVLFIIRSTYGYQKKVDEISIGQFNRGKKWITKDGKEGHQRGTGIDYRNISRTLANLVQKRIITKSRNGYISVYSIQKDYTQWFTTDITASDITTSDARDRGY